MNFYRKAYNRNKPKVTVDVCNNNTNGYVANGHVKPNGHINGITVSKFTSELDTICPENGAIRRIKEVADSDLKQVNSVSFGANGVNGYANGHLKVQ